MQAYSVEMRSKAPNTTPEIEEALDFLNTLYPNYEHEQILCLRVVFSHKMGNEISIKVMSPYQVNSD